VQGFGTELGLVNMLLYAIAAGVVALFVGKIKFLIKTDWEKSQILLKTDWDKIQRQHQRMWTYYVRHADDTGDLAELE
jgi:hypothetical protein